MAVRRSTSLDVLALKAADDLIASAEEAIEARGVCHLVLSGGNTPKALFKELASRGRDAVDWDRIELWWGDERCVPPEHAESNFGAARAALIKPLRLADAKVHRIRGEDDALWAANQYEEQLERKFGPRPVFDLVLLGLGGDGHTASLFPGQRIDAARLVVDTAAPTGQRRVTMTPKLLNAARKIRFLVTGADKSRVLAEVIQGPAGRHPAQQIQNADLVWFVDDAAARDLKESR